METIEETMTGNIGFGRKTSVTIIRNGDLATECYLKVELGAVQTSDDTQQVAWCRRLGHNIINSVTLSIGGSQIDKQYSQWLDLWYELTHTTDQERGYLQMIGDVPALTNLNSSLPAATLYIPLQFWFNRNTGLALPLIALQYHEVRLDFEFNVASSLICSTKNATPAYTSAPTMTDASLLVNYVYLDSEERRRFAQVGHEYLIEQVQFTGSEQVPTSSVATTKGNYRLGFNHPTKELIWAVVGGNWVNGSAYLAYKNTNEDVLAEAAQNLAFSLFTVGANAPSTGNPVNVVMDGSYTLFSGSVNVTTILTTATGVNASGTGAGSIYTNFGATSGSASLWMVTRPFGSAISPFQGALTDILVTLTAKGSNALAIESVTVNAHTLTIRDVSIPVSVLAPTVDYRVSKATDVFVNNPTNYGLCLDGSGNPVSDGLIQLNGQDRFDHQSGDYFNYVQTYQHHTRTPADGVNVYSFALHPEQHQPSGTANLSRIDNTQLNLLFGDSTWSTGYTQLGFWNGDTQLYVFAFSYNVLRIMSGMGGLAYSN